MNNFPLSNTQHHATTTKQQNILTPAKLGGQEALEEINRVSGVSFEDFVTYIQACTERQIVSHHAGLSPVNPRMMKAACK